MNKGDLIEAVASRMGETKANAARAVEAVLASIVEGLEEEERVSVSNFGTFRRRDRKPRTCINPATGERMCVPASTTVVFAPSRHLRDTVQRDGHAVASTDAQEKPAAASS